MMTQQTVYESFKINILIESLKKDIKFDDNGKEEKEIKTKIETFINNTKFNKTKDTTYFNLIKHFNEFKIDKPSITLIKGIENMKYKNYRICCIVQNSKVLIVLLELLYSKLESLEITEKNIQICNNDFSKIFITNPNLIYNFEEARTTVEILKIFNLSKNFNHEEILSKIINKSTHADDNEETKDIFYLIPYAYYNKTSGESHITFNLYQKIIKREKNEENFLNYEDLETSYEFFKNQMSKINLKF